MQPNGIIETGLYAVDLVAAQRFYQEVVGLELRSSVPERHLFFRCGSGMLLIFNPNRTSQKGGSVPAHGSQGPGHVAFRIDEAQLEAWRQQLLAHSCPIETEVEWPGGGKSIYFRDPAGNSLELTTGATWGI